MATPKTCKFECGTLIQWDTVKSIFVEQNGGASHTRERCSSLKQQQKQNQQKASTLTAALTESKSDYAKMHEENIAANRELVAAIKDLASALRASRRWE
jgi:capsule polysaccharide export protein KpsE/RkpR